MSRTSPPSHRLSDRISFLSDATHYPGDGDMPVTAIETHMSWIFLTRRHAYKLKKPLRQDGIDLGTPEARQRHCKMELALNRRLAPEVYLAVVPLVVDIDGQMMLGGVGNPVDWLVRMRRLPADRMLDQVVQHARPSTDEITAVARVLADFHRAAASEPIDSSTYLSNFASQLRTLESSLNSPRYALPAELVAEAVAALLRYVHTQSQVLGTRAARVVEGHGDLRPEHVCLIDPPVVIDCLEFNRTLRLLDPLDEFAYLALECERLGAPEVGETLLACYNDEFGERPDRQLIDFYMGFRALLRARLAIWHLDDPSVADTQKWRHRACVYIELACRHGKAGINSSIVRT